MNEDEAILFLSFIGYWAVLGLLTFKSDRKVKTGLLNLLIHIAYSSYFLYGLYHKSQGGTALVWFLYLLFILWIHTTLNFCLFIYYLIKSSRK